MVCFSNCSKWLLHWKSDRAMDEIGEWFTRGNSILMLPGWRNSGPQHWQTLWEKDFPGIKRVKQKNWEHPVAADWVQQLQQEVLRAPGQIILVAHSLGCITQALWAAVHPQQAGRIAGALLVAPADPFRTDLSDVIRGFLPMPVIHLPYPSLVIGSSSDPYCHAERSQYLAKRWNSRFLLLNGAGHINVDAGFGRWPYGQRQLQRLIRQVLGQEGD